MIRHILVAAPLALIASPALADHICGADAECDDVSCIGAYSLPNGTVVDGICDNEWDYCINNYCEYGDGDCDSNQCKAGLSCGTDRGHEFGYLSNNVDVCVQNWSYCSSGSPCGYGQADCDSDSQCGAGLACGWDQGYSFGYDPDADVCVFSWQWWLH